VGGLPDGAPGGLVKDPGSKRQDAHTQLVRAEKTSRKHDTALWGSKFTCLPRGDRDCSAVPLRYTHRSPSLNRQGDPRKWAKNRGQTRATPATAGVPKTQSLHANKIPEARVRCTENIR